MRALALLVAALLLAAAAAQESAQPQQQPRPPLRESLSSSAESASLGLSQTQQSASLGSQQLSESSFSEPSLPSESLSLSSESSFPPSPDAPSSSPAESSSGEFSDKPPLRPELGILSGSLGLASQGSELSGASSGEMSQATLSSSQLSQAISEAARPGSSAAASTAKKLHPLHRIVIEGRARVELVRTMATSAMAELNRMREALQRKRPVSRVWILHPPQPVRRDRLAPELKDRKKEPSDMASIDI
jgi:hypothetical protein